MAVRGYVWKNPFSYVVEVHCRRRASAMRLLGMGIEGERLDGGVFFYITEEEFDKWVAQYEDEFAGVR